MTLYEAPCSTCGNTVIHVNGKTYHHRDHPCRPRCVHCRDPIPPGGRSNRAYCGSRCQNNAKMARRRARQRHEIATILGYARYADIPEVKARAERTPPG